MWSQSTEQPSQLKAGVNLQFFQRFLPPSNQGVIKDLLNQAKLTWRLVRDPRVNSLYKLIPVGAVVYFVSPLDFAIPLIDDVAVLWLGNNLFMELCPSEVIEEHRNAIALESSSKGSHININEGDVIDAEYKEK